MHAYMHMHTRKHTPTQTRSEAESMSSPAFQRKARAGAQEFRFEAEVSRLMDIIIHSLYSNKVRIA